MGKIYKGWELIKAISDGEIKEGRKIKGDGNVTYIFNEGSFECIDYDCFLTDDYNDIGLAITEFELIEDEKSIDDIKELYINKDIKLVGKDTIESWTGRNLDITFANKINEILQTVKQIDKRVKKLERD